MKSALIILLVLCGSVFAKDQSRWDDNTRTDLRAQDMKDFQSDPEKFKEWGKIYIDGCAKYESARWHEARILLEKAAQMRPHHVWTWYYLGGCYGGEGERQKAIDAYENCLKEDPKHMGAWLSLESIYERSREPVKAKAVRERRLKAMTQPDN